MLFSVSPLAISSKDTAPFGLGLQPPRTGLDGLRYARARLVHAARSCSGTRRRRPSAIVADAGLPVPDGFFLDWVQTVATRVLHTSVPSFEYPRSDLPENVELVGPFLPAGVDRFDPPAWWDDVLRGARDGSCPVVLVTQGTVATDPERLLWPAIDGLADEDVLVVATTEPADAYPANVRAAPFVPFDRLLPLVDVMVTNGGFGGVQQALAAGVPVVVAGRSEDKAEVGARVVVVRRRPGAPDRQGHGRARRRRPSATGCAGCWTTRRSRGGPASWRGEYAEYDGVARTVSVVTEVAGRGR